MRIDTTKLSFLQNKSVFLRSNSNRIQQNDLSQKLQQIINANTQNTQKDSKMENIKKRATQTVCDAYIKEVSKKQRELIGLDDDDLKSLYVELKGIQIEIGNYNMEIEKFKSGLAEFDKAIGMFQDVLDGKLELPKGYTKDMVKDILNTTKEMRENYIKEKGKGLASGSYHSSYRIEMGSTIISISGADIGFQKEGEGNILFNSSAKNIYKELDRVSTNLNTISENVNRLLKLIEDEMKERGIDPQRVLREHFTFQDKDKSKQSLLYEYTTYNQYGQKESLSE